MIFYYSGTGNTRYAATFIARECGDAEPRFIPEALRSLREGSIMTEALAADVGPSLGIMFPIYSWGVPPVVTAFISRLLPHIGSDIYIWAVCTCGDEAGIAMRLFSKTVERFTGKRPGLLASVIMPNDYVLLPGFDVDSEETMRRKLEAAPERLAQLSRLIAARTRGVYDVKEGSFPALRTRLTFPLFRRWGVNPKKWKTSDACISCGRCAHACPASNIIISEGRPVWGNDCYSCCACYHVCPVKAISYGCATKDKGQYFFSG
ncbi:MAG: EFR1 family ferrodoxin [Muribaculaceae bacterium]|nr:EFR1 family ferrodoxin [Muribaculaceae bacterium]